MLIKTMLDHANETVGLHQTSFDVLFLSAGIKLQKGSFQISPNEVYDSWL